MSRIRWGILGAGKIARDLVIPAILLSRNGALSALASRDAARRNDFSTMFWHESAVEFLAHTEAVESCYAEGQERFADMKAGMVRFLEHDHIAATLRQ